MSESMIYVYDNKKNLFQWCRTRPDAVAPFKREASDSGYDITLLEKIKTDGQVEWYSTGVKVKPIPGIYFDLVPRSSMVRTGRMLANSVGVIDATYRGELIVCLAKIDSSKEDLTLPGRYVQIIPRQALHLEFIEVDDLGETERGEKGYGSSGK